MPGPLLKVQMLFCGAGARDPAPCQKWAISKNNGRIWKDACRVAGAVHETCSSEMLGGQGADFQRGAAFWSSRSLGLLRWYDFAWHRMTWHHFFRARRSTLDRWSGKNTKRNGTRPSALQSTFHFWKTSRRIASLLMLSASKIEEVSQNYCVFDAVKFESWGDLRIAAFLMLSSSRTEEVSQNIFVFRFAGRQIDRYRQTAS